MIEKNRELAATPPMGWNSWDCYGAGVTEGIVRANAEYMAKNLRQFGYEYIVVDIQWYEPTAVNHEYHAFADLETDEYGRLVPAENKFPSSAGGKGFAPLAEYIHSLGLKFGIHIMRGIPRQTVHRNIRIKGTDISARDIAKTDSICAWNTDMYGVDPEKPGAKEWYQSVFELYASWGVDFIKCDDIARELPKEESELVLLSDALKSCGREMVLSLSPGPSIPEKAELYRQTANMQRITDDFWDKWDLLYNMFERCDRWSTLVTRGSWADCDMLPIGAILQDYGEEKHTNFTHDEQRTMMTLWCIMRSPVIMGGDLTKNDDFTLNLLTNSAVLEMLRCSRFAHQLFRRTIGGNEIIAWAAVRSEGGGYLALFNAGSDMASVSMNLSECEIDSEVVSLVDLWNGSVTDNTDVISAEIAPHGVAAFRID